jgi:hypothetical protein
MPSNEDVVLANPHCEELRCGDECFGKQSYLAIEELEAVFLAAPLLRCLHTDVASKSVADSMRVLRNESGFERLRVRSFQLAMFAPADGPEPVLEVIAAAGAHASLSGLFFAGVGLNAAALDAVVEVALARRVTVLAFFGAGLGAFAVPALVRLLHGTVVLNKLVIGNSGVQLLDAAGGELLGAALRANSTLATLLVFEADLWREPAAATALVRALRGHRSLRSLGLALNGTLNAHTAVLAGAELAALLEADAPALEDLDVGSCHLGDQGLRPMCEALRRNTHLNLFECGDNGLSDELIRGCLLPALAANTSLRKLTLEDDAEAPTEAAAEAVAFVERPATRGRGSCWRGLVRVGVQRTCAADV